MELVTSRRRGLLFIQVGLYDSNKDNYVIQVRTKRDRDHSVISILLILSRLHRSYNLTVQQNPVCFPLMPTCPRWMAQLFQQAIRSRSVRDVYLQIAF